MSARFLIEYVYILIAFLYLNYLNGQKMEQISIINTILETGEKIGCINITKKGDILVINMENRLRGSR